MPPYMYTTDGVKKSMHRKIDRTGFRIEYGKLMYESGVLCDGVVEINHPIQEAMWSFFFFASGA